MEAKKQLIEGEDFYYDPDGNVVFTEVFHLKRGYCCGSGCKHCPCGNAPLKEASDEK